MTVGLEIGATVKLASSFSDIREDEWNALVNRGESCSIFQKYGWIEAWWQAFKNEQLELFIVSVTRDQKLVGLAPLFLQGNREKGNATLHFLGEAHADYLNVIVDKETPFVLDLLLEKIIEYKGLWHRFYLPEIPSLSPLALKLIQLSERSNKEVKRGSTTPCPGIYLHNNEETRRLLNKKSVKRHLSHLSQIGKVEVRHFETAEDIVPFLDPFFQQHVDRWSVTSTPSLFLSQANRRFYTDLVASLCKERSIIFTVIQLKERPIAFHFGFVSGNSFIWYKPSFDLTLFNCSPGEVLLSELISMSFDRKCDEFDFTRGDEPFKIRFSNHTDYNETFIWYRDHAGFAKQARLKRLKTLSKDVLAQVGIGEYASQIVQYFNKVKMNGHSPLGSSLQVLKKTLIDGRKWIYDKKEILLFGKKPSPEKRQMPINGIIEADLDLLLRAKGFPDELVRNRFLQRALPRFKKKDRCFLILNEENIVSYGWVTTNSPIIASEGGHLVHFETDTVCIYDLEVFPLYREKAFYSKMMEELSLSFSDYSILIFCEAKNKSATKDILNAGFFLEQKNMVKTFLGRHISKIQGTSDRES